MLARANRRSNECYFGALNRGPYITAPNCHATNSLCPSPCPVLLVVRPAAVSSISRKKRPPLSSMPEVPAVTSPQLIQMSSSCFSHSRTRSCRRSDRITAQTQSGITLVGSSRYPFAVVDAARAARA